MSQYNDPTYNTAEYSVSDFSTTYTETITSSDARTISDTMAALTESLSESDTLSNQDFITRSESITDSDSAVFFTDSITRTESIAPTDVLSDVWTALISLIEQILVGMQPVQYNGPVYNQYGYNVNQLEETIQFFQAPSLETISEVDTLSKQTFLTRSESIATPDTVSDADFIQRAVETLTASDSVSRTFLQGVLSETFGLIPTAPISSQYNGIQYNAQEYDERKIDVDVLSFLVSITRSETINSADFLAKLLARAALLETILPSDSLSNQAMPVLNEFIFFDTFTRVEITNKALNEILRLADWLSIQYKPAAEEWHD